MYKSSSIASAISHAEDILFNISDEIQKEGSKEQKELLALLKQSMEKLYFSLMEDSNEI